MFKRFFSAVAQKSPTEILTSFQMYKNYHPMQYAGFDTPFVSRYDAASIQACKRLFTHDSGVSVFKKLAADKNWLNSSAKNIEQSIADELALLPKDANENVDPYAEMLKSAGGRGCNM